MNKIYIDNGIWHIPYNRTLDETYISIVTAFDLKTRSKDTLSKEDTAKSKKTKKRIKPILFRCAFYILSPILVPVFLVIAFTTISIQGLISRFRVSKLLKFQQRPLINQAESDNHSSSNDELIESNLLTDALDVINIPGEETPDISKDTHSHTLDDRTHYYEVSPSPALKEISKQLNLDESICTTYKNLRLLEWERVWVYLSAFNAHGAIICRQSIHTTEDGIATIQHFLDTTQFSVWNKCLFNWIYQEQQDDLQKDHHQQRWLGHLHKKLHQRPRKQWHDQSILYI